MIDTQTVGEAFIKFLEDRGIATFNEDLFLGQMPKSAADRDWETSPH